jgi:hypothetical protein
MIEPYKIKGLTKLLNSGVIKEIYPMIDRIVIRYDDLAEETFGTEWDRFDINIFLNDDSITKKNMYDKDFDPHYLVSHHLKKYFPYFDIEDKVAIGFNVFNPEGRPIYMWRN